MEKGTSTSVPHAKQEDTQFKDMKTPEKSNLRGYSFLQANNKVKITASFLQSF